MRAGRGIGVVALLAATLGGCVSSQDIEGLRSQLSDLQRQVLQIQTQGSSKDEVAKLQAAITTQIQSLLKSEADMQVKIGSLSAQIDQLQGKLDDTNYRLQQLSQQIASQAAPHPVAGGEPGTSGAADPQALYQAAYSDYLRRNFDLAIAGFKQYLDTYPETDLADNAAYWIGECYFSQGKFQQAIKEFDGVITKYPHSDKLASAWLKKAYAYLELGQRKEGIAQLETVLKQFPHSDEANLARQRLRGLGVDVK